MLLTCAILLAALSRAELIDRFRAPPVVQVDGLVQVRAECDAAMRREYQMPIAAFAANICRRLYSSENLKERHFSDPGMVVVIGDSVTKITNVVTRFESRSDGSKRLKILVPAPGYADMDAFTLAVVRGYFRAVHSQDLSDAEARSRYRRAIPELRLEDEYRALEAWYAGRCGGGDDEEFLRLQRGVLDPGRASAHDVRIFASRLYLYPECFDQPFAGRFDCVSFREAIRYAGIDPRIRYAAYLKIQEAILYSGGHGPRMSAAGIAYSGFLRDLFEFKKSEAELTAELDAADELLKGVLE